jgi:hypothetical protein
MATLSPKHSALRVRSLQKTVIDNTPSVSQRIVATHIFGWDLALQINGMQWAQNPATYHCMRVGLSIHRNNASLGGAKDGG